MSNEIQFDFDEEQRPSYRPTGSKFAQSIMKYSGGLIKNETQANFVLVGFAILALSLSFYLMFGSEKKVSQQTGPMEPAALKAAREAAAH